MGMGDEDEDFRAHDEEPEFDVDLQGSEEDEEDEWGLRGESKAALGGYARMYELSKLLEAEDLREETCGVCAKDPCECSDAKVESKVNEGDEMDDLDLEDLEGDEDLEGGDEMSLDDEDEDFSMGEASDPDEYVEIDEAELAEALANMDTLTESDKNQPFSNKAKVDLDGEALALKEQLKVFKRKLREAEATIAKFSAQLDESNLFNAKLLYANKLLNRKDITKEEKVNVIETLDEARSLREDKLVYNTFAKNLTSRKTGKPRINESTAAGGSSRSTGKGGASTQHLNESTEFDRWQRLAGIIQ